MKLWVGNFPKLEGISLVLYKTSGPPMPFGRKSCEDISKSFQIKSSDAIWEEIVRMHFRVKRCLSYGVISLVLCDGDLIELLALSFEISRWGNLGWGGWGNHWRDPG